MATGSSGYLAISEETTPGVAVAAPDGFYPVEQVNITSDSQPIMIKEIRGSRQAYRQQPGSIEPQVTLKGAIYPDGVMAKLMKGLLGAKGVSAVVAPSATAYKHPFIDAPVLPTFTIERATAFSDDTGAFQFCQRVAGAKVESFSVDLSFNKLIEFNATLQATGVPDTSVTPVDRATAETGFPTMAPLYFGGAVVNIDGAPVSLFESLKIDVKNTLTRSNVLNGQRGTYKVQEAGVECSLSGTLLFEDQDFYDHWANNDVFQVVVNLTNDEYADQPNSIYYGMDFTWDLVSVQKVDTDFNAGEVIRADVTFTIDYDQTNRRSVLVDLVNLDDGTSY